MAGKEIERPYGPGWLKMQDNSGQLVIEDANMVFRNFAGREGMYNREGDRNFCVIIPDYDVVEQMIADGWNIKQLKSREEGVPGDYYIQVSVGFKGRPPNLVLISSKGRVPLGQHECEILDWIEISKADIIIRPYNWSVNGKTGVKAYLKSLFVTMNEDYLELKYSDVPLAQVEEGKTLAIEGPSGTDVEQVPYEGADDDDIIDAEIIEEGEPS